MLIENGINGLTSQDYKLLSFEQKKISLYDELFKTCESGGPDVLPSLQNKLEQTNMSFPSNETDDLMCSPCEDPFGSSHAFCKCTNTERTNESGETSECSPVQQRRGKITYELDRRRKTVLAPFDED